MAVGSRCQSVTLPERGSTSALGTNRGRIEAIREGRGAGREGRSLTRAQNQRQHQDAHGRERVEQTSATRSDTQ
jgi:hypothetical protein